MGEDRTLLHIYKIKQNSCIFIKLVHQTLGPYESFCKVHYCIILYISHFYVKYTSKNYYIVIRAARDVEKSKISQILQLFILQWFAKTK